MTDAHTALYKFLDAAHCCPVTGRHWPTPEGDRPGAWVERAGPCDPDGLGFVLVRGGELAPWACSGLYRAEVDGDVEDGDDGAVIASRVRLLRVEQRWSDISRELSTLALSRVNALQPVDPRLPQYAADVAQCVQYGMINGVLFVTAWAHGVAADPRATEPAARREAFLAERALQSRFIAERIAG
jgi:hypothetical protein